MALCPRSGIRILSPFFCIKEGFCKWIVFNFKGRDLKDKKVYLLIQCWLPEDLPRKKKYHRPVSPRTRMLRLEDCCEYKDSQGDIARP